jgi:AraC-like DNA-binding protein
VNLDAALHRTHKDAGTASDFGMDSSGELLEGGFALYSTVGSRFPIGPIKSEYFRISLVRGGSAAVNCGLEQFHPVRDTVIFGFPGQVFSIYDATGFDAYYMLFSEAFIAGELRLSAAGEQYPFLTYAGAQSFQLTPAEAAEIEQCILAMNTELKKRRAALADAIRLYIRLILIHAKRAYIRLFPLATHDASAGNALFQRFIKAVGQHFIAVRKVADYAAMLHVSPDHLNRTIKSQSGKTAHEFVDEMLVIEAKALLLHTQLSVAEIAYRLDYSDPSHFNKFFRKLAGVTPLQYRGTSV